MVSEPLGLVLLGVFLLLVVDLRDRPTWPRTILVGLVAGVLTLTRPEQLAVAVVIVTPVLLGSRIMSTRQRLARFVAVGVVGAAVLAPWAIYNSTRFAEPVLISTGEGNTFLAANCAPGSFSGERMGFWDNRCPINLAAEHPGIDESELGLLSRSQAVENLRDNFGRLPSSCRRGSDACWQSSVRARRWEFVAQWLVVDTWLVWAWVVSFWAIFVVAGVGVVMARRRGRPVWPLVAPFVVPVVLLVVSYGEPRYHAMADLGLIVLAGYALDRVISRRSEASPQAPPDVHRLRSDGPESRGPAGCLPCTHPGDVRDGSMEPCRRTPLCVMPSARRRRVPR